MQLRATALSQFQFIHQNVYSANISELNPLKDGQFVLAMKPGGAPSEIIVAEGLYCRLVYQVNADHFPIVLTMYSKSTNHDWIPLANSVGTPSYIYVQAYQPFGGAMFSSMCYQKLSCSTFLQIPRTHILFSLASFPRIQRQEVAGDNPVLLVTLCKDSFELYEAFHRQRNALHLSIQELGKKAKSKNAEDGPLSGHAVTHGRESSSEDEP